jgi:hypothetical protein
MRAKLIVIGLAGLIVIVFAPALARSSAAPRTSLGQAATRPAYCPSRTKVLNGVYHSSRLTVKRICQRAVGTVRVVRHEEDGDLHIDVEPTPAFQDLLNGANQSKQHGWLVVEFMARDGGHLPAPAVGDKVTLIGAWVLDAQHGWNELHPVWREILRGSVHTSGPRYGGSPDSDRSSNAARDCRDSHGQACVGYGSVTGHTDEPSTSSGGSAGSCEPGYSPCLPVVADLNCADIPDSKKPIHVTGSDPYRLDADHDGLGCEP